MLRTTTTAITGWMMILLATNPSPNGSFCHAFLLMTPPQLYRHIHDMHRAGGVIGSADNSGSSSCDPRLHTWLLNSKWDDLVEDDEVSPE